MRVLSILVFAFLLATPQGQAAQGVAVIPGATVQSELLCAGGQGGVSYLLVATDEAARTYHIPGIAGYPVVSVLSSIPGDVTLTGDRLTWRPHMPGDVAVVVGGGAAECPTAASAVTALYGMYLPTVLH